MTIPDIIFYIETYNKYILPEKEKDLIKVAYYNAVFTNSKQAPKPLSSYLDEIDRIANFESRKQEKLTSRKISELKENYKKVFKKELNVKDTTKGE